MSHLPPTTALPQQPLSRRHQPRPMPYERYRQCLRWDHGFSCALCLLHEADLAEAGVEGLGLMWIEHREPQSTVPEQADTYANCYYSCRFCNQARRALPTTATPGGRLLDPVQVAWAQHFEMNEDEMRPRVGDSSTIYTYETYDLGDVRKAGCRSRRRRAVAEALQTISEAPALIQRLLKRASEVADSSLRADCVLAAESLRRQVTGALESLRRYRTVPVDAQSCACSATRELPAWLGSQVMPLPVDAPGLRS